MASVNELLLVDIAHKRDLILDPSGDLDTIAGRPNVIDAIMRRIVTRKGSLIHRPEYGASLGDYQNAINSVDRQLRLIEDIRQNLQRDTRIVSLEEVSVSVDDLKPDQITIRLRANIIGLGAVTVEEVLSGT